MITSEELIHFGRSNNPCFLSYLMSARNYQAIVNKCAYSDPNYGACWFRAKLFPLGSAEEVVYHAIKLTAHEIAIASNVYYDALVAYAKQDHCRSTTFVKVVKAVEDNGVVQRRISSSSSNILHSIPACIPSSNFSFSFQPYQMMIYSQPLPMNKKLKVLFGTSQIEY